jgi:signal transduction histidine kinase/ActR/RegA family two-component response regulator
MPVVIPPAYRVEVETAQDQLLYRNALVGQAGVAAVTILLYFSNRMTAPAGMAMAWLIYMLVVSAARAVTSIAYSDDRPLARRFASMHRRRVFVFGTMLTGLGWSAATPIFMATGDSASRIITSIVLAGVVAGAVPVLSAVRSTFYLYALLALLPVGVFFFIQGTSDSTSFGILTLVLTAVLMQSARYLNDTLTETLILNLNSKRLATDLAHANQAAAERNVQLQREIAEREKIERALTIAKNAAEAANHAKGQFVAGISHEVRTPMNGIIGLTELTLESDLTPAQRGNLSLVRDSARNLLAILNQVLDFSKIDAGNMQLESVDFELQSVMTTVFEPMRLEAERKGLRFENHYDADLPAWVKGDPVRLAQILSNLCNNAIKFTPTGMVTVAVGLSERSGTAVTLTFSVRDTGIGIAKDKHRTIFAAFSQADASTTRRFGGTGLGLSIVEHLVAAMNGQITLTSAPGEGSEFLVALPFAVAATPPPQVPRASPDHSHRNHPSQGHVLVVEDNLVNQLVAKRILENGGFQVSVADNGRKAVQMVSDSTYDAVLMDMQMPDMDGVTATIEIRKQEERTQRHIPIIACTASAMVGDREHCLAAGMDDYISKPVTAAVLCNVVKRWTVTSTV